MIINLGRCRAGLSAICFVVCICALAIGGCSSRAPTNELIDDLSSTDGADRVNAARLLQQRQGDAATVVPALIEALKDSEAEVRRSAAIGLGYFGKAAETALPALEGAERDADPRVREAARVARSRITAK